MKTETRIDNLIEKMIKNEESTFISNFIRDLEQVGACDDEMLHRKYDAKNDEIYFVQISADEKLTTTYHVKYVTDEVAEFDEDDGYGNLVVFIKNYSKTVEECM